MDDETTTFQPDDLDDDGFGATAGGRSVAEFLPGEPTRLDPDTSLRRAAEALRIADTSLAVVADGSVVLGVVSERDIVGAVALGLDLDATAVQQIESEDLKWATSTSTVDDVAEEMLENYLRHVLIADDDGELLGVVSMRDLLTAYLV